MKKTAEEKFQESSLRMDRLDKIVPFFFLFGFLMFIGLLAWAFTSDYDCSFKGECSLTQTIVFWIACIPPFIFCSGLLYLILEDCAHSIAHWHDT